MYHEYIDVQVAAGAQLPPQAFIGNGPPYMVGRLSYAFGLTGPCVSTDTACSSSLVAAHLAHRALLNGESAAAVAGGINIMLLDGTTAGICQLQVCTGVMPLYRCPWQGNDIVLSCHLWREESYASGVGGSCYEVFVEQTLSCSLSWQTLCCAGSRLCQQWGGADRLMQLGTAMAAAKALPSLCYAPPPLQHPILHWESYADQLSTRYFTLRLQTVHPVGRT